jgi:hypothetical protein
MGDVGRSYILKPSGMRSGMLRRVEQRAEQRAELSGKLRATIRRASCCASHGINLLLTRANNIWIGVDNGMEVEVWRVYDGIAGRLPSNIRQV